MIEDNRDNYFGAAANELFDYVYSLCDEAGYDRSVGDELLVALKQDELAMEEFVYYYKNDRFLCKLKIGEYTAADIMVWQMDHFRAHMDRLDNNRYNRGSLIICTFITLIVGNNNPDIIIQRIASETGTDLDSGWSIH